MHFDAIHYWADGTSGITMYRGGTLNAVVADARAKLRSRNVRRVDVFDLEGHLVERISH